MTETSSTVKDICRRESFRISRDHESEEEVVF